MTRLEVCQLAVEVMLRLDHGFAYADCAVPGNRYLVVHASRAQRRHQFGDARGSVCGRGASHNDYRESAYRRLEWEFVVAGHLLLAFSAASSALILAHKRSQTAFGKSSNKTHTSLPGERAK